MGHVFRSMTREEAHQVRAAQRKWNEQPWTSILLLCSVFVPVNIRNQYVLLILTAQVKAALNECLVRQCTLVFTTSTYCWRSNGFCVCMASNTHTGA
jgi:hypothetical protein